MELMINYGMKSLGVLKSATSGNAEIFHLNDLGNLLKGFTADIIAVEGDPTKAPIEQMREVTFVRKDGKVVKNIYCPLLFKMLERVHETPIKVSLK